MTHYGRELAEEKIGTDIGTEQQTALMFAAGAGNEHAVKAIMETYS